MLSLAVVGSPVMRGQNLGEPDRCLWENSVQLPLLPPEPTPRAVWVTFPHTRCLCCILRGKPGLVYKSCPLWTQPGTVVNHQRQKDSIETNPQTKLCSCVLKGSLGTSSVPRCFLPTHSSMTHSSELDTSRSSFSVYKFWDPHMMWMSYIIELESSVQNLSSRKWGKDMNMNICMRVYRNKYTSQNYWHWSTL